MSIESHRINQKNWALRNPEYSKNWKRANREKILEQRRPKYKGEWQKHREKVMKVRTERSQYIQDAKNKPCMDCKVQYESFIMHFDHRDPKTKLRNVCGMGTYTLERIKAEIAKCDVVCANCHARRTHDGVLKGKIKMFGRYCVQE